jgi:SH2 domain
MDTLQLSSAICFDFGRTVSTTFETSCPSFHASVLFSWYFAKLSRTQADKLLKHRKNQTGAFLIRDSDSQPGQYAMSIRHKDTVKHYRIRTFELGGYAIGLSSKFK